MKLKRNQEFFALRLQSTPNGNQAFVLSCGTACKPIVLLVYQSVITFQILLSWKYPFKLSGRCLQLLLDVFLCHDFSITNFLHALKFCVLEHFYEQVGISSPVLLCLSVLLFTKYAVVFVAQ